MRIALLTPTFFEYSGIDRLVENKALKLKNEGNKVAIFTFYATIKAKYAEIFVLGLPKNQALERAYRLFFFLDLLKVIKYTKILRGYDSAVSYFYPMNILAYFAKRFYNIKYIYYNAGVATPNLFKKFSEKIYLRIFNFLNNLTIKNADEIISISTFLRDELKKETGLDSKVEYPIIDKKRFNKNVNGKKIRLKYKLGNSPVVLYVGRISPHKGVELLLESFKIAKEKANGIKLLIVGKPTFSGYFQRLKKISEGISNDVIFAGFVPDNELPGYYAACNIYATASLWEGYNLTLDEAQACGKKVVAFDLCSHPEVVKNGVLVKPYDTHEFAEVIVQVLSEM